MTGAEVNEKLEQFNKRLELCKPGHSDRRRFPQSGQASNSLSRKFDFIHPPYSVRTDLIVSGRC